MYAQTTTISLGWLFLKNKTKTKLILILIFCTFLSNPPSLCQRTSVYQKLSTSHQQGGEKNNTKILFPFLHRSSSFFHLCEGGCKRALVVTSAIHVCQFSEARAPVVEVIVVLVAPAARRVEGA